MMIIVILGALCLGIVIGWLCRYFLNRLKVYTIQSMASIVTILIGGTVTKFLNSDPWSLGNYFYPVGLLIGVLAYPLISRSDGQQIPVRPNKTQRKPAATVDEGAAANEP